MWELLMILFAGLFGLFRGIDEGITMTSAGPRAHGYFRWYHLNDLLKMVFGIAAVMAFDRLPYNMFLNFSQWWVLISLAMVVQWTMFEFFYSFTRYHFWVNPVGENIVVADLFSFRINSYIVIGFRLLLIVGLIGRWFGHGSAVASLVLSLSVLGLFVTLAILWLFK